MPYGKWQRSSPGARLFEQRCDWKRYFEEVVDRERVLPYLDYSAETKAALEELRQKVLGGAPGSGRSPRLAENGEEEMASVGCEIDVWEELAVAQKYLSALQMAYTALLRQLHRVEKAAQGSGAEGERQRVARVRAWHDRETSAVCMVFEVSWLPFNRWFRVYRQIPLTGEADRETRMLWHDLVTEAVEQLGSVACLDEAFVVFKFVRKIPVDGDAFDYTVKYVLDAFQAAGLLSSDRKVVYAVELVRGEPERVEARIMPLDRWQSPW